MSLDEDLRRELGLVADRVAAPHVELPGVARLGERERRRRRGLAAGAVAAAVVAAAVLVPVVAGGLGHSGAPQPAPQPAPRPDRPAPTLRADLDGDGQPDDVFVDEPAGAVTVTTATGDELTWSLRHPPLRLLGAARLGRGREGLVLEGWTGDGGRNGAVVLLVHGGRLLRADPDGIVIDRDHSQTMWVEDGVFRHAVCLCSRGWQPVSVYRVALRPDGTTLRSVEDRGRCWNPAGGRPPEPDGWPTC